MNRRAILLALAKDKQLTPERALAVRADADPVLLAELAGWGSRAALNVVDVVVVPGDVEITDEEAQQLVDLHLMLMGFETVPVRWLGPVKASSVYHVVEWAKAAMTAGDPTMGMALGYHGWPSYIMTAKGGVWEPLHKLIKGGILPYGLDQRGFFVLVRK